MRYEIPVEGVLDDHWSAWFDSLQVSGDADAGTTTIAGPLRDQAALTDCSLRSAISASRCLRCAALDPTDAGHRSSHKQRRISRPAQATIHRCRPAGSARSVLHARATIGCG